MKKSFELHQSNNKPPKKPKKLKKVYGLGKEREYFFDSLSMMTKAGIPVGTSLDQIIVSTKKRSFRKILKFIAEKVSEGSPLWSAVQASGSFSEYSVSLIRIGEETGRLSENLAIVATQEEKQRILRSKVKAAMAYPAFVLTLTAFIGLGISWMIFPRLSVMFDDLHVKLPLISRILVGFGNFMQDHGVIVVLALIFIVFLFIYSLFIFGPTKKFGHMIAFSLPGAKGLLMDIEIQRLGLLLGTLLEAGLSIGPSIESLDQATSLYQYKKFYAFLKEKIIEGESFEGIFLSYKKVDKILPRPIEQMIISGEKSGMLAATFLEINKRYEKKTDFAADNLAQMVEPVLLVIVWLGVVGVALAVIMPIYGLLGGLNNSPQTVSTPSLDTKNVSGKIERVQIIPSTPGEVNGYAEPSSESAIVKYLRNGEIFDIQSKGEANWVQIKIPSGDKVWVKLSETKFIQQ